MLVALLFLIGGCVADAGFAKVNPDNLKCEPNSQKGKHPGGIFFDQDSYQQYYIKFYPDAMHARAEFLAIAIYAIFGIDIPKVHLKLMKNPWSNKQQLAFISEWEDDLGRIHSNNITYNISKQLAKIHLISALIKNTDAGAKNTLLQDSRVLVIDAGKSFKFGSGDRLFGPKIEKFCDMVDPEKHLGGKIFAPAFKRYTIKKSDHLIDWLNHGWDRDKIKRAIKRSGIDDGEMVFANLQLRFQHLKMLLQDLQAGELSCQ